VKWPCAAQCSDFLGRSNVSGLVNAQTLCGVPPMWWANGSRDIVARPGSAVAHAGCGCPALLLPGLTPDGTILLDVIDSAGMPRAASLSLLGLALGLTILLPLLPWLLARWRGLARSWTFAPVLVQMGCTVQLVAYAASLALTLAVTVCIVDSCGFSWPAWWNVDHTCTYHVMFCEPTQNSRLVRHPGNAYSNIVYAFNGFLVLLLQQTHTSPLRIPDACFASALIAHAVASFLWHASNAPKVHYVDLAAMDSVIIYLQIRCACVVMRRWCRLTASVEALLCAAMFVLAIAYQVELNMHRWQVGAMDSGFPTGRSRLAAEGGLPLVEVCLFILMPLLYYAVPCVAMMACQSVGSLPLAIVSLVSLFIGWEVHLLERWALDGLCVPSPGLLGAATSPTAIFHASTGVTLLAGYLHVRSLEHIKR